MSDILVSIVCITYNHEKYIRDTLEGIINQKVSFGYEVIVHDDASTDRTAEIIKEYEEKNPHIFRCIYRKENRTSKEGVAWERELYRMCRGKYIALCEGDDFWIDYHKLQIQVEWMENHPEYIMTAHNALRLNCGTGECVSINPYEENRELFPRDIILQKDGNLPTASLVMRHDIKEIESFYYKCGIGDFVLQLFCISKGRVYYFDRIMSVYRFNHEGSWWSGTINSEEKYIIHYIKMIRLFDEYSIYVKGEYDEWLEEAKQNCLWGILNRSKSLTDKKYNQLMERIELDEDTLAQECWLKMKDSIELFRNPNHLPSKVEKAVNNKRDLYIWGTGYYGTQLAERIKEKELDFQGFVVSDNQNHEKQYMEKEIISISELYRKREAEMTEKNNKCDNIEIVVAVNLWNWKEIRPILEEMKIFDFRYLFDL